MGSTPGEAWYSSAGVALAAFAVFATGLAYASGHAGTTEGGA